MVVSKWCPGVVVITTAQLHLTKPDLRFSEGPNPACSVSEVAMVRISHNGSS